MGRRLELDEILKAICPNVYFQPPANVQMQYPAIVYERDRTNTKFADDRPFVIVDQYSLKLISKNPDDSIFEVLKSLPMCSHERHYVADSLNHEVFSIFF